METCSSPGCDQPGTKQCSACKSKAYCGPICQTADWSHHKEECPGHLRKVGMAHLEKAKRFHRDINRAQALRHAESALSKLKLLTDDRPLEDLDEAFSIRTNTLKFLGRHREAMESAKERYSMWAMTDIRNPASIWAAFDLIDCCIHLQKFVDAEMFARTAYEIINEPTDNIIPLNIRQQTLARGARFRTQATLSLAQAGGIAPEAKQAAGVKAIALAREALEIERQLYGAGSIANAYGMGLLAGVLAYFNDTDDDDDEVFRRFEQATSVYARMFGTSSVNVATSLNNCGSAYVKRACRARDAHDLDRDVANHAEALRIKGSINGAQSAIRTARNNIAVVEEEMRQIQTLIAAQAASSTTSKPQK